MYILTKRSKKTRETKELEEYDWQDYFLSVFRRFRPVTRLKFQLDEDSYWVRSKILNLNELELKSEKITLIWLSQ